MYDPKVRTTASAALHPPWFTPPPSEADAEAESKPAPLPPVRSMLKGFSSPTAVAASDNCREDGPFLTGGCGKECDISAISDGTATGADGHLSLHGNDFSNDSSNSTVVLTYDDLPGASADPKASAVKRSGGGFAAVDSFPVATQQKSESSTLLGKRRATQSITKASKKAVPADAPQKLRRSSRAGKS